MKDVRISLLLVTFLLLTNYVSCQEIKSVKETKNLVFLELLGFGGYGSLNYERLLINKSKFNFSTRVGISTYHLNDFELNFNPDIIIPLGINIYYGNKNFLDISIGQTITNIVYADPISYSPSRSTKYSTNLSIGYRFQKTKRGMMYKIAYAPIIENNSFLKHWALLNIGYNF